MPARLAKAAPGAQRAARAETVQVAVPRLAAEPRSAAGPRSAATQKQKKAAGAADCHRLEQLPNVGPALAADLRLIGIQTPAQLKDHDALSLYRKLCAATGQRQDPCVLDTFMAITDFMAGAAPAPWWRYTAYRKRLSEAL